MSTCEQLKLTLGCKPGDLLQKMTEGKVSEFNKKSFPDTVKRNDPETISNAYDISLESSLESWLTH